MSIVLRIPDSVAHGLLLPEVEAEPRLPKELAVALYAQGILSFGKAAELAGISCYHFSELIIGRAIPRHYGENELAEDLEYARGKYLTDREPCLNSPSQFSVQPIRASVDT